MEEIEEKGDCSQSQHEDYVYDESAFSNLSVSNSYVH
jgi:hypothetical protein